MPLAQSRIQTRHRSFGLVLEIGNFAGRINKVFRRLVAYFRSRQPFIQVTLETLRKCGNLNMFGEDQ